MKHIVGIAALGLALLAGAAPARAQRRPAGDDALQRAVVLFEESERAYNEGDFAEAAAMLRRAYELHPDPTLLFNLARALEGMGDLDGAIDGYERYLAEAGRVEDRGAIERRLSTLRDQRAQLASMRGAVSEPAPRGDAPPSAEASSDAGGHGGVDVAPWIVMAAGVLVVGAGIGVGVASQDYDARAAGEPVMATAVDLHAEAETLAIVANVLFVAGGLTALGGAVWGLVSLVGGEPDAPVTILPTPGGALLRGRF